MALTDLAKGLCSGDGTGDHAEGPCSRDRAQGLRAGGRHSAGGPRDALHRDEEKIFHLLQVRQLSAAASGLRICRQTNSTTLQRSL